MLNKSHYNLINANIVTLDDTTPKATTVTIKDNKIFALDAADESLPSINLQGACIIPGLVDAHFHLKNLGKRMELINLKDAHSINEILNIIRLKIDSFDDLMAASIIEFKISFLAKISIVCSSSASFLFSS